MRKKIQAAKTIIAQSSQPGARLEQIIRVGIFITAFLPLLVGHQFLFPFVGPRTWAFRILVEGLLVLLLWLGVVNPRYRLRWQLSHTLLTAFIAILGLTALTGVDAYHSFWGSVERSEGILTWLHLLGYLLVLTTFFRTPQDWLQFFRIILAAGAIQIAYGLGEALSLPGFIDSTGSRVGGTLGNSSFLASYLVLIAGLAAYVAATAAGQLQKIIFAAQAVLAVAIIWLTQTRGAFVALAAGALFFSFLHFGVFGKRRQRSALVVAGILLFAAIGIILINRDSTWVNSRPMLHRLVVISSNDITTQNRLIVWGAGGRAFLGRPLLGWGWENFNAAFSAHFDPSITRDIGSQPWYDRAHNIVVEVAVAAGVLGLVTYAAIFFWPCWLLWQRYRRQHERGELLLLCVLIAYGVQNLFVFDTLNSYLLWIVVIGFASCALCQPPPRNNSPTLAARWLAWAAVFMLLPVIYFFNLRPALANYFTVQAVVTHKTDPASSLLAFQHALDLSPPGNQELRFILVQHTRDQIALRGINDETIPLISFASQEMQKSLGAAPHNIQNYLLLAELYLTINHVDPQALSLAEIVMQQAQQRAPARYQIYTLLGRIAMSQGDYQKGIKAFEQAIALNDQFAETHWNLGIAYILSRNAAAGTHALERAQELGYDIYSQPNIIKLLQAYRDSQDISATIAFLRNITQRFADNSELAALLAELEAVE